MGTETRFNCCTSNNSADHAKAEKYSFSVNTFDSNVVRCNKTTATEAARFLSICIDENNLIKGAKEVLSIIRPQWNINAVKFKKFTDGITNKLIGCFYTQIKETVVNNEKEINDSQAQESVHSEWFEDNNDFDNLSEDDDACFKSTSFQLPRSDGDDDDGGAASITDLVSNVVLIRVYGHKTSLLIDRQAEVQNIILLQSYGFAPALYATFKNGLAYEFVPGVTLNPRSALRAEVWRLVARRMAEMHRVVHKAIPFNGNKPPVPVPMLWAKTQSFLDLVPERFSDAEKQKRLADTFLPITRLRAEFESLYHHLESLGSPLVFAHNDLLLGNVIYTESLQSVTFIDYEYADYNFQAFDIGNHFAEYAGVDKVDYARYPGREFQFEWLRVYLQTYLQRPNVTDAEVHRLYVQVNQFALASHFFWTIWSLIQAEHSTIDFDYVEYAFVRYREYLAKKEVFLALDVDCKR